MKFVFRVDSAFRMGIGHLMRCLTLANKLKENHEVHFISRPHLGHNLEIVKSANIKTHILPLPGKDISDEENESLWLGTTVDCDAKQTNSMLQLIKDVDYLVVDHYGIDKGWHQQVRPFCKHIIVIDDLANRDFDCDILLDQTYGRKVKEYKFRVPNHCAVFTGSKFTLLRDEFKQLRDNAISARAKYRRTTNILVSLGGSDPNNIGPLIIDWLIKLKSKIAKLSVTVVANNICATQYKNIPNDNNSDWLKLIGYSKDMSTLMLDADIAIGAAGATAWERCCLGLPTLTIVTANNQITVNEQLANEKAIIPLGHYKDLCYEKFTNQLENLIKDDNLYKTLVSNCFHCIDGEGANRFLQVLLHSGSTTVTLTKANIDDCKAIFDWQKKANVRKYMRNSKPVDWQEHVSWFNNTLKSKFVFLYLIKFYGLDAGTLRLDKQSDNSWEISIVTAPHLQGNKIAYQAIKVIPEAYRHHKIIAEVHPENIASHKLFAKAGFKKTSDTNYELPKRVIND